MVRGKQCFSKQRYFTPHKYSVGIPVIIGLSQTVYDKTIRVTRGSKSEYKFDLGEYNQTSFIISHDKSPSPHELTLHILHKIICRYKSSQAACTFLTSTRTVFLQVWLIFGFFPHRGFTFPQATLILQSWGRVT